MKTQLVRAFLLALVGVLWLPSGASGQGAPMFVIKGEPSEISGTTNNAIVTPTVRPGSYTGTLKVNGSGSVNFMPATVGSGAYFQFCCSSNNAYYQFTGPTLGNIFNPDEGEISFYLTSRQSYAQRQTGGFRTVFGVEDAPGNFLFSFITVAGGFGYRLGSTPTTYYFLPNGQQDSLFGLGVTMKVRLTWDGSTRRLYLNDVLQQTTAYVSAVPVWTADSVFLFGAANGGTIGVNSSDDVIDEFTVAPLVHDAGPPSVSVTFPTAGSTVSGNVNLQATASDDIGVVGVLFQIDGVDFSIEDFASPYSASWNTAIYSNGTHTITAKARDAAENTTTSAPVSVTVFNAPDTTAPVLSGVSAINIGPTSATISWTTDEASDSQVVYGLTQAFGSASAVNSLAVSNHTVTLTGLTPNTTYFYQAKSRDTAGNTGLSATLSFRTAVAGTTGDVNWTNMPHTPGWPGFDGWLTMWYDAISRSTVFYVVVPGSQSIYSTDIYFYSAVDNVFRHLGGTGSLADSCPPDTPTQPGDRHPQWQMTIDTRRNRFWLMGGSNAACHATRQDTYYLSLLSNPLNDSWHQVAPLHLPLANISSAIVYDPDTDALVAFGTDGGAQTHDHWIYCPSDLNPTPGKVTARQAAAGCTAADDWVEVTPFNGKVSTNGTQSVTRVSGDAFSPGWTNINIAGFLYNVISVADSDHLTLDRNAPLQTAVPFYIQPPGNTFTGMLYDTATKKMIQFGGQTGAGTFRNETWVFDVLARKWRQGALTSTAPTLGPSITNQPAMAYNSLTHKIYFHQTTGAGYPADWLYDPIADTWVKLAPVGTGAVSESALSYDPGQNVLIGWTNGQVGGPDVWQGQLPGPTGDTTAPNVSITAPSTGAGVSGNISISVDASDASGVAGVQLQVDGVNAGGEGAIAPYQLSWDSASVANGNHTLTVVARDKANNTRVSAPITLSVSNSTDNLPPTRSNGLPTGSLPSGTAATTISLSTNEPAACWFTRTSGTDLSMMEIFEYTGGTTHYTTAGPLTGGSYVYYVRCVDIRGNTNPDEYVISFAVSSNDGTPPVRSSGTPTGNLPAGTTSTTLGLTTNENATCRYSQTPNTAYASMTGIFTTTGGTAHQTNISGLTNGTAYSFLVRCIDTIGNVNPDDYAINFSVGVSDTTAPLITNVNATGLTVSSATITWTTNELSDSQVDYGTTLGYGLSSALNASPVLSHSVQLTGLTANTLYHYQVKSRDGSGNLRTAGDFTFQTTAGSVQPTTLVVIKGEATELSGIANNAIVTPNKTTLGLTGILKVNGTGSVNFPATQFGTGVYFLNCCAGANNAYYQFSGATLGSIFNTGLGEVEFYLTSRQSYAQRQSSGFRTVFGVEDTSGNYLFSFVTSAGSFSYRAGASGAVYYVLPAGQQDVIFGNGVTVKIKVAWDGTNQYFYINDVLKQSNPYTKATANWGAGSMFVLGGADYGTSVANVSDDVIDEFTIRGISPVPDTQAPTVSISAPSGGSTVQGAVTVTATAQDDVAVAGVQFLVDDVSVGAEDTTAPYSISWDSTTVSNGSHVLKARARDGSGNNNTSAGVTVIVNNPLDTTPPVRSNGTPTGTLATGTTSTALGLTTNENATCRYSQTPNTAYASMLFTFTNTGGVSHSTTVGGLSSGNTYTYYVRCQDAAANANTNDYAISFSVAAADTTAPLISNPTPTGITATSATITWTTNEPADSQLNYGLTASYGQATVLDTALVTNHSVTINGLSAGVLYHYKVLSRDGSGNLGSTSTDLMFTTSAGVQTVLRIAGEPTELSGTVNNSIVTPAAAPAGFTGTLKVNAPGSVVFSPATVGMGVSFLSCCSSTNNAYYQFTGASLGNVFSVDSGEISFSLKSTKTFAQRQAAGGFRTVFGVEDSSGHFIFSFLVQAGSFSYRIASAGAGNYSIPAGQENTLFGSGVTLRVRMTWDGTYQCLFLNDVLVQKNPYTKAPPVWSASSVFLLGGADYGYGVFNVNDDIVDEFIVKR